MRLIDADVLLKEIEEEIEAEKSYDNYDKGVTAGLRIALRDIKKQTTIEAEPVNGWISVKDRLPPYGERVLVINEAYGAEHRYTKYNIGVTVRSPHLDFTFWGHKVTHWQPLPKPPKGE